jgi:hypothetical protein
MSERKVGTVFIARPERGFYLVRVGPPSSLEKYFLHTKFIRSGTATPAVGMSVEFEPGPIRREGELPQAFHADVTLDAIPGLEALSGRTSSAEEAQ